MTREAGLIVRAERARSPSASVLGAIRRRGRASNTTRPFTIRLAKRSAFSISGFSNGITAACLARLS
jgi:hypothetical protein